MKKIKTIALSVKVTEEMNEKIEEMAKKKGLTKSGLIRYVVTTYIDQESIMSMIKDKRLLETIEQINEKLEKMK